ncbi:MAG: TraR/DksA C4-type zinc finger protein [Actinobacteria bacterium]|jgi:RNA polymerase-binding transcription factor DksA|nr:TraR/DksA C4-type zinc finger protein [Actinomycetota bacterium]
MGTNKQRKPTKPAKPAKKAAKASKPAKKAPAKPVKKVVKKAPVKKIAAKPVKKVVAKKAPVKKIAAKKAVAKKAAVVKAPGKPFPKKDNPVPAVVEPPKNLPKNAAATAAADGFQRRLTLPPPAKIEKRTSKAGALKPLRDIPTPLVAAATEAPWSNSELKEMKVELSKELIRLRAELVLAEAQAEDLLQDSGDGAGDDQADAGAKTFEREHEISLVYNARDMVMQTEHALDRISAGSYGKCEDCGNAIGKARLQVFPRATLCMICKQKEERR